MTEEEKKKRMRWIQHINNLNEMNRRVVFGGYPQDAPKPPDPPVPPVNQYDLTLVIGDSNTTRRASGAYGPTPAADTAYQWNPATGLPYMIAGTDILQTGATANQGSVWPKYCINRYNRTGRKQVVVTTGVSGSNVADPGDTNNWTPTGANYAPAIAQCDAALAYYQKTVPDNCVIGLTLNDANDNVNTLTDIRTAYISLIDRLTAKYPGMPIKIIVIGVATIGVANDRILGCRNICREMATLYSHVSCAAYQAPMYSVGDMVDQLHLNQNGYNVTADMLDRYEEAIAQGYSKWVSTIIACQYSSPPTEARNRMQTFFNTLGLTRYLRLNYYYNFTTWAGAVEACAYTDWTLTTLIIKGPNGGTTFVAGSHIGADGLTGYYSPNMAHTLALRGSTSDYFETVKIKTNRSTLAVARGLVGCLNASAQAVVVQSTTSPYYRSHDLTLTAYTGDTLLASNSAYGHSRLSGNKQLAKNGVVVNNANVALTSSLGITSFILAINNTNGTPVSFLDADVQWAAHGELSSIDHATLFAAAEASILV